jgi:hypothetical protein
MSIKMLKFIFIKIYIDFKPIMRPSKQRHIIPKYMKTKSKKSKVSMTLSTKFKTKNKVTK